jgi:hypothetical protein
MALAPSLQERLDRERLEREELARRNFATLDHEALLQLRPGMNEDAVIAVLGPLWTPRVPADKGYYLDLSPAGLILRMDISGHLGRISLHRAAGLILLGLHCGMQQADVLALYPHLVEQPSDNVYGYTSWQGDLPSGDRLVVRFGKEGDLVGLSIESPSAQYATGKERIIAAEGKYPPPAGAPGAPFADPNLKLAVLDALMRARLLDLGTPQALADHVLQRHVDLDEEGYALLQPVYDYLVRYPLSQPQLDAVTRLVFDGGLDIYTYPYPFWDGESDEFDIRSFAGIEHCANLRELRVISMVADEANVAALQAELARKHTA